MRKILAALFVFWASGATAADYHVADTGNDVNDCLSPANACATMQRPVDISPPGKHRLYLHCGKPAGQECQFASPDTNLPAVDVSHFKRFAIFGDCSVVGFKRTTIMAHPNRVGVQIQDHATATAQCVAFGSGGSGSKAWALRQMSVGDCAYCTFLVHPGGLHISLDETAAKWNCIAPIYVEGGADVFANASRFTEISLNCTISFQAVNFADAVLKTMDGAINIQGANIANPGVTGKQLSLTNGILEKGPVTVPGSIAGTADAKSVIR
jgi:hypothetical protein